MSEDLAELCDRFAELAAQRSDLEEQVSTVKKLQEELKQDILQRMQETGISRLRSERHERTIYLRRQLWAGAKDGEKEKAVQALRAAGLEEMVFETFSTQTLTRYVRDLAAEQDRDLPDLPPELAEGIQLTEKFDIRAVRSK